MRLSIDGILFPYFHVAYVIIREYETDLFIYNAPVMSDVTLILAHNSKEIEGAFCFGPVHLSVTPLGCKLENCLSSKLEMLYVASVQKSNRTLSAYVACLVLYIFK